VTYDRTAIMRGAHKRFRDGKRLGLDWTFGQCPSTGWAAAKERRKDAPQGIAALASSPTSCRALESVPDAKAPRPGI
jgi:hypothetical protein